MDRDRGKFVRHAEEYKTFFNEVFSSFEVQLYRELLRVPYTHFSVVVNL